ncbi:MAG: TilS substrate-binding domain-containing protein, partial [Silvanigrellaceae bacterium]|nr:TilS substrate-binding domain-containing protein [Silvanigrellaceae bacterium]
VLESYARQHQLVWIEDDSNLNPQFSRNFLRQQVLPLLESTWPQVVKKLTRTAKHCRDSQSLLTDLALLDKPGLETEKLSIDTISSLPYLRLANVVRAWLKKNGVRMPQTTIFNRIITEVIFARKEANPSVEWGCYSVRRYQNALYLVTTTLRGEGNRETSTLVWSSFPDS